MTANDLWLFTGPIGALVIGALTYWVATRPERPSAKSRPPAE